MKIADLDYIRDETPYVGYTYSDHDDTPLHILVGRGHKKWGKHRREVFFVTRCNRLISWMYRNTGLGRRRLCARCGSRKDFEKVLDERHKHDGEVREERMRKEALDEANRIAEWNWSKTRDAVSESIVEEAESMIASGEVMILLEKDDLALIRKILRDKVRHFKGLGSPMYHQRDHATRLQALLDDVLIN